MYCKDCKYAEINQHDYPSVYCTKDNKTYDINTKCSVIDEFDPMRALCDLATHWMIACVLESITEHEIDKLEYDKEKKYLKIVKDGKTYEKWLEHLGEN